jgi:endoglucanase
VGITSDVPGVSPEAAQERLGGGPGLFLWDTSELPNRKLVAWIEDIARQAGIPLQTDLVGGYGDDSSVIQKSNGGVPTVNLVIPTRYTHAHNGMIDRTDFDRTVDLVVALLQHLDGAAAARIRSFAPEP